MVCIIILVINYHLFSNVSMMDNFLRQDSPYHVMFLIQLLTPPHDRVRKIHHNRSCCIFLGWMNSKIQSIILITVPVMVRELHGPHHEAVMVRELCIAIDENRFTVFTAEEMCHLVEYLCTI